MSAATLHHLQDLHEQVVSHDPCDECMAVDSEMNLCKGCSANPDNEPSGDPYEERKMRNDE